jgi:YggT family protein
VEQAHFLAQVIDLYTVVVFIAVVVSWFQLAPDNPVVRVTRALTEPVLAPIRALIPPAGGLDFSPMILLILLRIVRGLF